MTHAEFVAAYRAGEIHVNIDRDAAGRFVSARLLLPLVRLPVLGLGVALALIGWMVTGFIIIAIATLAPIFIRRSAPHFVLTQSLQDSRFYDEAVAAKIIDIARHGHDSPAA